MGLFKGLGKIAQVAGAVMGPTNPWGAALSVGGSLLSGGGGGGPSAGVNAPVGTFTPYAVSTGFANSVIDPNAKTATYTLTPEAKAMRDRMYAGATSALPNETQIDFANRNINTALGLFDRATNMDIGAMTSDYYNNQLSLLEPGRAQESSRLADIMFGKGTLGHGVAMGGGYVNPQQYAQQMAREQQNKELLFGAEDRARSIQSEDIKQANALYGLGQSYLTQPYETANTLFGYGAGIEGLGANSMALGMNMGSTAGNFNLSAANTNAALNQTNYLNSLNRYNRSNDAWNTTMDTVRNTDWSGAWGDLTGVGGIFGPNSTIGTQAYQLGIVDPTTYGGTRIPGVNYFG